MLKIIQTPLNIDYSILKRYVHTIAIGTLEIPTVCVPKGSRKMLKLRCDPEFFSTCRDMLRKPGKVQDV